MKTLAFAVLLTGCVSSDAPRLLDLQCNPTTLRAAAPGPYRVSCDVTFEGAAGSVRWDSFDKNGLYWVRGTDLVNTGERDGGMFHFVLNNTQPPPIGTLSIQFEADDDHGNEGPAVQITTHIQVVP